MSDRFQHVGREHVLEAMLEMHEHGEAWLFETVGGGKRARPRRHFIKRGQLDYPAKAICLRALQLADGAIGDPRPKTNETSNRLRALGFTVSARGEVED